jgi:N-acetylmuramoyl-L-alanine amidase
VAKVLVACYQLDDITGHDCIAPERKDDPGPAFPMAELRAACGFTGLPAVHRK